MPPQTNKNLRGNVLGVFSAMSSWRLASRRPQGTAPIAPAQGVCGIEIKSNYIKYKYLRFIFVPGLRQIFINKKSHVGINEFVMIHYIDTYLLK